MVRRERIVVYIHGKGGSAKEAEHYQPLFADCDVVGMEYGATTPWEAKTEFPSAVRRLSNGYASVALLANSIGAYFAMQSLSEEKIEKAYFISPVVDMERLIIKMMGRAKVTEAELQRAGEIATEFGETLSYSYLRYVRENPVRWRIPAHVAYGEHDDLTSLEEITDFARKNGCSLTILQGGEHYFHTAEQMQFLDTWIVNCENAERRKL